MKIILLSSKEDRKNRSVTIGKVGTALLGTALFLLPVCAWIGGIHTERSLEAGLLPASVEDAWRRTLLRQRDSLQQIKYNSERELEALTVRMAQMQARLLRIDALGERVTQVARFDSSEFNFSKPPAMGGPESVGQPFELPDFRRALDRLEAQLKDREQQLAILDTLLVNRQLLDEVALAGKPIAKGWVSSGFGHRTDPFKGSKAWHNGIDFAGRMGSDVVTVASGVVTWSGERQGVGLMVEISHGGGYVTRYAHNQSNLVGVGDVVKKGQAIAKLGSSGRSTGPHVHFEVYKNGQAVDPASYIDRPRSS
jgi:murein DD-endopeptidase MepM/ murein hydrolase activator NlpD